jgi:hypothetical protein
MATPSVPRVVPLRVAQQRDRADRAARITALMGVGDPRAAHLARGIRDTARLHHQRHVVPIVLQTWPDVIGTPFGEKLRIGACDLYASAPYMALFCGRHRPALVRVVTALGNGLPIPPRLLGLIGRVAMVAIGRLAYDDEHRRIALVSAFIVVVDHVFDHCMTEAPEARGRRLEAIIAGRERPDTPELALTQGLALAMAAGLDGETRRTFDAAMAQVYEWIRAEVRGQLGVPDPLGFGHRRAGVEGTIAGLLFPVARFADDDVRSWMVDVSMYVQIMDDYLDLDADRAAGRETPATLGQWTSADVAAAWERTTRGLEDLVRRSGLGSPRYTRFIRDAYVLMMVEVVQAMIARPDDGMVPE